MNIAFIGNPNCGKTTLFNALTGKNLKVGNYPGVTVEKIEGVYYYKDRPIKITDLPGIYSLDPYSLEEKVAKKFIENENIDFIINIVDASCLEKSLYLTLQLIEKYKNVIIVLNMMDILKKRGMKINIDKLEKILGTKVILISAKNKKGLKEISEILIKSETISKNKKTNCKYKKETEEEILKKYDYISYIMNECVENRNNKTLITDKIDKILVNQYLGLPIFIMMMATVFFLTFTVGDYIKMYFDFILNLFSQKIENILIYFNIGQAVKSLIMNGMISGVVGILSFLPNIFILFMCLGFLEDTGYMSRATYVMSSIMKKLGLSGRSCISLILGFGCSVPAIMSTRTLKNNSDKRKTIRLIPCMSCSAKIPIYVLFSEVFFYKYKTLVVLSMYIIGIIISIIIAFVDKIIHNKEPIEPLIIELPEYKMPDLVSIAKYAKEKIKDYLQKAGTTILTASVILWGLLNIGIKGYVTDIEESFGFIIANAIIPIFRPIGLGYWQIIISLIAGISAKEVVISSLNVLLGKNALTTTYMLHNTLQSIGFNQINAICLMIFCLLYVPCIATISTIRNETKSYKFTIKIIVFQITLAWIMSFIFYQIAYK